MAEPAPTTNEPTIEADPELTTDDSDSTLGDDVSRYTASLTSSIERYPIENNRRYERIPTDSQTPNQMDSFAYSSTDIMRKLSIARLPCARKGINRSRAELDRLDLTHQKLKILLDEKLLLCPVENPGRVLDVGTGTGIWAIEYGTVPLTMQKPESLDSFGVQGTSTLTPTYWGLILARLNHPGNENSAALMKNIRD
ncbi:MAG: hypothetical protein Q9215_006302 [Flavoplaca cf. flavocitrina]